MFEEDIEYITPYDLALANKNQECRHFAMSLKPIVIIDESACSSHPHNSSTMPSNYSMNGANIVGE